MAHIAVSYLALVGVQMVLISAQTMSTNTSTNTTAMPMNSTFNTMNINSTNNTMMSTMKPMGTTVNMTDTNYTNFHSTQGPSTKLPHVTPPPPDTPPPRIKTTAKSGLRDTTTARPAAHGEGDRVGIIIIVVIIVITLLAALFCFVARKRGRRYSVDLSSRQDEVQIPLSAMEPSPTVVTFVPNGLQFEGTEGSTPEPQEPQEPQETQETTEPEVKLEDQVEQKVAAEREKVTADASADSAAPPAETPEDQSTQDVPEQSPAAPVEPSGEEKTDDEGAASDKTSVEPPKEMSSEANENNSNSTVQPQRGARDGEAFWDASLDSMV